MSDLKPLQAPAPVAPQAASTSAVPATATATATATTAASATSASTQAAPAAPAAVGDGASQVASGAAKPKAPPRPIPPYLKPLQFMGVPRSVLTWQPRLPSRNWSIFLVTVGTLSYLYYDDRKQCRKIRQDYIDKVAHLGQETMKTNAWPRKVVIYTTKSPGDDDYDQALRYFKKYVKPVLVAAAVDWEVTNGTKHGGLARELQARFQERRRKLLGLEPWDASASDPSMPHSPFALTPQEQLQREIDGGIVLVGRPALKEWAWALKHGWSSPLEVVKRDRDQEIAAELAEDHAFDEVAATGDDTKVESLVDEVSEKDRAIAALAEGGEADGAGAPLTSRFGGANNNPAFKQGPNAYTSMLKAQQKQSSSTEAKPKTEAELLAAKLDPRLLEAPAQIPAQPPICFVDFSNLVGWRNIPLRMYNFFRVRDKVQHGAELGLQIVYGTKETARDFQPGREGTLSGQVPASPPQGGDLDWGLESEERYAPYFLKTPKNIRDSREAYYKALPQHLKAARDLAGGLREPSRLEKNDPPKAEMELRERRLKEVTWRNNEMGYEIIKPDAGVEWDERWRGSVRVLQIPQEQRREIDRLQEERRKIKEDEKRAKVSQNEDGVREGEVELKGSAQERVEKGWKSWF